MSPRTTQHCARCGAPLPPASDPGRPCARCLLQLGLEPDDPPEVPAGAPPAAFPPRTELERLHPELALGEVLGEGGMGIVYRATQRNLERPVALKILRTFATDDAGFQERFEREAKTLARLAHPHIVSVHDSGRRGGHYYLLMELVDGTNLRRVIQDGELRPAEALAIVEQVCSALTYAHAQGVVHRDIKPENILLDRAGRVKIADFGLAKLSRGEEAVLRLTRSDQAMGTPQYMAPEQLERPLEVDHRADLYSLGVVFYELLTGELPLGRFATPSEKAAVDARLDAVVLRTLEKEPARRYQAAAEITTDLDALRGGGRPAVARRDAEAARAAAHGGGATARRERSPLGCWGWAVVVLLVLLCLPLACALVLGGASVHVEPGAPQPADVGPLQNR